MAYPLGRIASVRSFNREQDPAQPQAHDHGADVHETRSRSLTRVPGDCAGIEQTWQQVVHARAEQFEHQPTGRLIHHAGQAVATRVQGRQNVVGNPVVCRQQQALCWADPHLPRVVAEASSRRGQGSEMVCRENFMNGRYAAREMAKGQHTQAFDYGHCQGLRGRWQRGLQSSAEIA
jgi:hypothetical protein